jgi:hypothetical protein
MEDMTNVGDFCSGTYTSNRPFIPSFLLSFCLITWNAQIWRHQPAQQTYIEFHSAILISYCCIMKRNNTFLQTFPKSSIKKFKGLSHEINFKNLKILTKIYRTWPN